MLQLPVSWQVARGAARGARRARSARTSSASSASSARMRRRRAHLLQVAQHGRGPGVAVPVAVPQAARRALPPRVQPPVCRDGGSAVLAGGHAEGALPPQPADGAGRRRVLRHPVAQAAAAAVPPGVDLAAARHQRRVPRAARHLRREAAGRRRGLGSPPGSAAPGVAPRRRRSTGACLARQRLALGPSASAAAAPCTQAGPQQRRAPRPHLHHV
jgi:hypothetical protein